MWVTQCILITYEIRWINIIKREAMRAFQLLLLWKQFFFVTTRQQLLVKRLPEIVANKSMAMRGDVFKFQTSARNRIRPVIKMRFVSTSHGLGELFHLTTESELYRNRFPYSSHIQTTPFNILSYFKNMFSCSTFTSFPKRCERSSITFWFRREFQGQWSSFPRLNNSLRTLFAGSFHSMQIHWNLWIVKKFISSEHSTEIIEECYN